MDLFKDQNMAENDDVRLHQNEVKTHVIEIRRWAIDQAWLAHVRELFPTYFHDRPASVL